jgi:hypothetical protein
MRTGLGMGAMVLLRALLIAGVVAVLAAPADDPRFAGKGIAPRTVVLLAASLLIPVAWLLRRRREPYPGWIDALWVSVFVVDIGGNVLDLYNRYAHFDLIPHAHGTGAATVVAGWLWRLPVLSALGVATVAHILLEAQEYYSDVFLGLHNVRGTWDVVNDLLVGIVGSVVYGLVHASIGPMRHVRD